MAKGSKRASTASAPAAEQEEEHRLWFTRSEAAVLCGIGDRAFDGRIRPRLATRAVKGAGAKLRIFAPAVVEVLRGLDAAEREAVAAAGEESHEPTSAALEEWRSFKRDLAALELEERRRKLISVESARAVLSPPFNSLRAMAFDLARLHGPGPAERYNEGLEEFERELHGRLQDLVKGAAANV